MISDHSEKVMTMAAKEEISPESNVELKNKDVISVTT